MSTAGPAVAYTGTGGGASVTVGDVVAVNGAIHLEGSGWLHEAGNGSKIAIKLGSPATEGGVLATEPAAGPVNIPGTSDSAGGLDIWAAVEANADGTFAFDVPFPTPANTAPALATAWAVGTTHHLTLLTGSMEAGDTPRTVGLTFTIGDNVIVTVANGGGRGAAADQVTITASASASSFAANEVLTATVDGAAKAWTTGGTASATGALPNSTLVFAPGTLRAGPHTVVLTGTTTAPVTRNVTSTPAAIFAGLTQGASGTLTLKNLPTGASVSAVSFDDATFTGLPAAADDSGAVTVPYTIPANASLGTFPVTVTTTNPAATYTLAGAKVSPDPGPIGGEGDFTLVSNGTGLYQGLYQTAYSASRDALFATAASGTGASEDGYLYKLDADTLAVEDSVHPKDLTVGGETGKAPYGVGVDDVNGTVWVSNTRTNTVAVYDADDLTLLRQFPTGTVSHSRDVVYDASTNRVFISSASEGTNGDGYISVFEGGDNDGDGTPYEKITDVQTGPRADFNPISLSLANGTLVTPSLQSNKVAKIDTTTLAVTYLTVTGIDVGGRGASGIAYDAAGNRLFIASQNSDEVVIADATTGATLKEVGTGSQALNVAWDAVHELAYVTNLGSTSVTVLDEAGDKIANLPITRSNHVSVDGRGNAYVADKNSAGNQVWKITPIVRETPPTSGGGGGSAASTDEPAATEPVTTPAASAPSATVPPAVTPAAPTALPTVKWATPKVAGAARVGRKLTADVGSWTRGTKLTYQWFADGRKIAGATERTFTPTKRQQGKKITVKVTGTKAGYRPVTKTSHATAKVAQRR